MSTAITMIVPVKNTLPTTSIRSSVSNGGDTIKMAAPVKPETSESKTTENSSGGKTEKVKAPAGASPQLKTLYQQLNDLFQKIDNLKSSDASPEEIQKQVQILTNQAQALQAAIARMQQEETEKNKSEQMVNLVANNGDGINRPTEDNTVDVYI